MAAGDVVGGTDDLPATDATAIADATCSDSCRYAISDADTPPALHASRRLILSHTASFRPTTSLSVMDKKNTVIGVLLIGAAIAYMFWLQKSAPPAPLAPAPQTASASAAPAATPGAPTSATSTAPSATAPTAAATPVANTNFAAVRADSATATVTTLSNSFIEVRFTDSGGAIRDVLRTPKVAWNDLTHLRPATVVLVVVA